MRILLAIDQSEPALRARDLAASLPWPDGSTIRVVTVVSEMAIAYGGEAREHLATFLDGTTSVLAAPARTVETAVLVGRAATVIAGEASAQDLIIIGSHGRGGLAERVLGSTSAEVIALTSTPVLIARTPTIGRVVLADDGSSGADAAASMLASSGVFTGLPTHVVSVVDADDPVAGGARGAGAEGHRREALERVETRARILRASGFADVVVATPEGEPAECIARLAADAGADLIVMGTHGRTGLRRMLAGSVAWSVLHQAAASVLVVNESTAAAGVIPTGDA